VGLVFQKKKKNKNPSVMEYKLLFKQAVFQGAERAATELNVRIFTGKEN